MLEDQRVPLEAGGKDKVPAVSGHHGEGAGGLDVSLLEALKHLHLAVPQVHLREGVVTSQRQVVAPFEGEGLQGHGAPRRQRLDLGELLGAPADHLGVADVARHGQVELVVDAEVLDGDHVLHVGDVALQDELLAAAAPLVDDRHLRATGQEEVGFAVQVQELCIGVAEPLVQRLVGVEALLVPLVERGEASLGAVGNHEKPICADLEGFDVVGFGDLGHLNVLKLAEAALVVVKLVDVRTTEELSHDDKHLVLYDHRRAADNRLAWGRKRMEMTMQNHRGAGSESRRPRNNQFSSILIRFISLYFYFI